MYSYVQLHDNTLITHKHTSYEPEYKIGVCVKVFVYTLYTSVCTQEYRECCSVLHYNTLYTHVCTQKLSHKQKLVSVPLFQTTKVSQFPIYNTHRSFHQSYTLVTTDWYSPVSYNILLHFPYWNSHYSTLSITSFHLISLPIWIVLVYKNNMTHKILIRWSNWRSYRPLCKPENSYKITVVTYHQHYFPVCDPNLSHECITLSTKTIKNWCHDFYTQQHSHPCEPWFTSFKPECV